MIVTAVLVEPTAAQLLEVAELFDEYRLHYGEPIAPGQSLRWLTDQIERGRLSVFTARIGQELVGLATTAVTPASLRLSHFWQLRDLYVVPGARRRGAARALLDTVRRAATEAGALRLSVQTESSNAAALRLYRTSGFTVPDGLAVLVLPLVSP